MPAGERTLPHDWYPGTVPANVEADATAYLGTSYSFRQYRSTAGCGLRLGRGASLGDATLLDVGPRGCVTVGAFALVSGACLICDASIEIGDHTLIAWNVVVMDSYRVAGEGPQRWRSLPALAKPRPVCIGSNVWIGFEACVLPGVRVGEGSIIAARAVVEGDVPAYSVVAGNPARVVRRLCR
jgi:acetyltransferase-like isoleucine patch superfamily enzyme